MVSPSANRTLPAQPTSSSRSSERSPSKNGSSTRRLSSVRGIATLRRADRRDLLCDVDADGAPRDAAPAADAAGRAELVEPRPELVRHPLPVAAARRGSDAAPVDV